MRLPGYPGMFVGDTTASAANMDNVLNLGAGWTTAEFAVLGDGGGTEADFNPGSAIVVRTAVHYGSRDAPTCVLRGLTAETNNLNLGGTAMVAVGASPAIVSFQSNTSTTPASCSAAHGIGDTHLITFKGLLYDFQATGDFVLTQRPGFLVQTRQVSGAPTWPNAAVNSAVATRIGTTRIGLCLSDQLQVNGRPASIGQGVSRLPGGVDILRTGNAYLIRGPGGDSVRAVLNPTWIDVFVGLGRFPTPVRGLLANANNNVNQLVTSTGQVLREPVSFKNLYGLYGNSWRVRPGQSLLCGKDFKGSNPTRPFYAQNLARAVAKPHAPPALGWASGRKHSSMHARSTWRSPDGPKRPTCTSGRPAQPPSP